MTEPLIDASSITGLDDANLDAAIRAEMSDDVNSAIESVLQPDELFTDPAIARTVAKIVLTTIRAVRAEIEKDQNWEPTRWFRTVYIDGQGKEVVWAESSDEKEIRASVTGAMAYSDTVLFQRLYRTESQQEWKLEGS